MSQPGIDVHPASFRDPSGFIFTANGVVYRQVNNSFATHYDHLMNSGLYTYLVGKKWLLSHKEVSTVPGNVETAYKILEPDPLHFTSFAYEWCFGMLKDAALLTLRIAGEALKYDMILKDASPSNVQWHNSSLIFIDTLSFEKYESGKPWIAYRQFCESFLAPLVLMHYRRISLHEMQLAYPTGIPLQVTSRMLPWKSRLSMLTYLHIHLHAKIASRPRSEKDRNAELPKDKLLRLLKSLEMLVSSLKMTNTTTTWGAYYEEASLRDDYVDQKRKIISGWLEGMTGLLTGIDIGANDGSFSGLLAMKGIDTIAADADPTAIGNLYAKTKIGDLNLILPLIINFANPSPANGANGKERAAFLERASNRDIGFCLALIHHLHITHHLNFNQVSSMLSALCKKLVIEFVPATDPKVKEMMEGRENIFTGYTKENFENAFGADFNILNTMLIPGTERRLYLMERR